MPIDRAAAETFIWSAARLVDRHRYALLFADGPAEPVVDALRGYRNEDGGFGHALEPDLRAPSSQPASTLYALEILHEAGALDGDLARDARAWVASVAAPGKPFARTGHRGPGRGSPRPGRGRPTGRRRLDVRLAGLVAGTDDRLARHRHDPRADVAAGQWASVIRPLEPFIGPCRPADQADGSALSLMILPMFSGAKNSGAGSVAA